jgi:hypothetical protein
MRRRDILKALPAAALTALPAFAQVPRLPGVRIKITDIRILRLRVIKELGSFAGFMGPWDIARVRTGGGSVVEVQTDQGLVGIGPAIDPVQLPALKAQLIGQDPFNLQFLVANMREMTGMGGARRTASLQPPLPPDPTEMTLAAAAGRGGDHQRGSRLCRRRDRHVGHHRQGLQPAALSIMGAGDGHVLSPYASQSRLWALRKTRAELRRANARPMAGMESNSAPISRP